jgi:hypothetical protein
MIMEYGNNIQHLDFHPKEVADTKTSFEPSPSSQALSAKLGKPTFFIAPKVSPLKKSIKNTNTPTLVRALGCTG